MDADPYSKPCNILLVDDEKSSRMLVGAILRRLGYGVEQAVSATEALARIKSFGFDHFDLVISDYWMPEQNGLELLKYISLEDPTLSLMLITGDGERKILENLIQINGCDFLQKPVGQRILRKKTEEAVARTSRLRHLRSTELEANTLGETQRVLLQKQIEAEWPDIEFFFTSKSHASGDFVSVIPLQGGKKALLISDASGHDLSSALQSNYFHGLARGMLTNDASMESVFEHFNSILLNEWNRDGLIGHSLSATALIFDETSQKISLINAGAPHPTLSDRNGFASRVGLFDSYAPLGWFEDSFQSKQASIEAGYLCTWTDGLSDLADSIGVDPLALADRLLDKKSAAPSIMSKAMDDIAVVRVRTPQTPHDAEIMVPLISIDLTGDRGDEIDSIQNYCEKSLRISLPQLDSETLSDLLICLREALINALKHGCRSRQDLGASLRLSRSQDLSKISIQIRDEGTGHSFDWEDHAAAAAENLIPEHRGLIMMQSIPSRTDLSDRGSCVLMEFDCESAPQSTWAN